MAYIHIYDRNSSMPVKLAKQVIETIEKTIVRPHVLLFLNLTPTRMGTF